MARRTPVASSASPEDCFKFLSDFYFSSPTSDGFDKSVLDRLKPRLSGFLKTGTDVSLFILPLLELVHDRLPLVPVTV